MVLGLQPGSSRWRLATRFSRTDFMKDVFIYGLFSKNGKDCLYVGRSGNPKARAASHLKTRKTNGIPFDLRIIKRSRKKFAQRNEALMIRKYKNLGQARFNISRCAASLDRSLTWKEALKIVLSAKIGEKFNTRSRADATMIRTIINVRRKFGVAKKAIVSKRYGKVYYFACVSSPK